MHDTAPDLDGRQDLLGAIPAEREDMGVVELDGYVAPLIVCPGHDPAVRMASGGLRRGSCL